MRNHASFPDPEVAPERHALNCVRILTRVLPYVYEADHLETWEEQLFWENPLKRGTSGQESDVLFSGNENESTHSTDEPSKKAKPLGEELLDVLIDLLFYSEFTLPVSQPGKPKVTYGIWQTGVGCHTPMNSTREYENNRTEILKLLLVMCGKAMYMSGSILPVQGVRATTYLVTCPDKQIVLSVLCSLLNTASRYNPATWRVPVDQLVFRDNKQILVAHCLQLLLVVIMYPIPETTRGIVPKNFYRHYLGRLHRPQDFQFIVEGMNRILSHPVSLILSINYK